MTGDTEAKRADMVAEFKRAVAANPNCAFHWIVIPETGGQVHTRGHASTSDLAQAMLALITDAGANHVYGRCSNCDKLAMAFLAADRAFRETMGAALREGCQ